MALTRGEYRYFSPFSGEEVDENGNIIPNGTSTIEWTNNLYDINGGRFFEVDNRFNNYTLGQQGPVRMVDLGNGRYEVTSQTLFGQVNRATGPEAFRLIDDVPVVTLANGEQYELTLNNVAIAGAGKQWLAYPTNEGLTAFTQVNSELLAALGPEAMLGIGARLATPMEAAELAIRYALTTQNREILNDIADAMGFFQDDGNPDVSGTIRFLMKELSQTSFRSFLSFLVEPPQ